MLRLWPFPKIFIIGFNKCGTKTFNGFFRKNGIRSLHCRYKPLFSDRKQAAALVMESNVKEGRPVLTGLNRFQAFSDLIYIDNERVVEANTYFREMHRDHPNAYFIFNDRPLEAWINSRLNHEGSPKGSFVGRAMSAYGMTRDEVTDLWRRQYAEHKASVLEYFAGSDRFLHFDITTDGPEKLIDFLRRDVRWLDAKKWKWLGSSEERVAKRLRKHGQASDAGSKPA